MSGIDVMDSFVSVLSESYNAPSEEAANKKRGDKSKTRTPIDFTKQ